MAAPIADILNTSFSKVSVPRAWKLADVPPLPKGPVISDFNKDLLPISLTSTLSKIAESFVIEEALKPVVLSHTDPGQFSSILGSCSTFELIFMFHHWLCASEGYRPTGWSPCRSPCQPTLPIVKLIQGLYKVLQRTRTQM